ncbi:hypothetical protein [Ruegeria arenilitoris]|uniref:hypothetical protein n=1 Tax=Ruegeria arenilitoris TaxID=1173585 RepID=UPI00147DEFAA|nr:hypothetical protein [Ruegeria arenilitoris]
MRLGVRTKKACEIAEIDPARFNEMVHVGHFPCAPETRPGSARIFDLDQTVALTVFGYLLSLSVAPDQAGQIACSAYRVFAGQQNVDRVVCRRDAFGEWTVEQDSPMPHMTMSSAVRIVIDVSELREQVGEQLEWEEKFGRRSDNA